MIYCNKGLSWPWSQGQNIFLPFKIICWSPSLPSNFDYRIDIVCNVQCLFVNQNILHRLKSNWLLTMSWPWSHVSWNYNYLCNQCLQRLLLWVRISNRARSTTICDKVGSWLATDLLFSPDSENKLSPDFMV
jgi:hypothetical protein